MRRYIHELPDWPRFHWDREALAVLAVEVRHRRGLLLGRMEGLGVDIRKEAELETLTLDVLKSSEIEGEHLNRDRVRSSIARRLGLEAGGTAPAAREVEGVVEMMLDATQRFAAPLTADRIFGWHAALFPTGRSGGRRIIAGAWRDDATGPMQVVSGPVGREKVHYEAPAAPLLPKEMPRFVSWANESERTDDITPWLEWFLACLGRAFDGTEATLATVMRKARFWERAARLSTNDRQRAILNRLLEGFIGKLTTQKWATLAKCSHDTALRDIQGLIGQGLLKKNEGGRRSTSYSLDES